jgi:glycosyltransferase involved in cell wall biosynthesis
MTWLPFCSCAESSEGRTACNYPGLRRGNESVYRRGSDGYSVQVPIRVASVPADHPYVRHLGRPDSDEVERLSDRRAPGQRGWWPPRMLEPEWVEENASGFDLFHVQFGFDGRHPEQLAELCELLRGLGKPLVYTVHDLRNPNHETAKLHAEQMEVLIEAAAAVVTLTDEAGEILEARYGRSAVVIPHPHVVPLAVLERPFPTEGRVDGPPRVGVHLKSLRANMLGVELLEALSPLTREATRRVRLQINLHEEIWDPQAPGFRADLRCLLERERSRGRIDLRIHPYFDDAQLYEYLRSLDVAILPYRFGTHSGWLEACRDLGTAVVAPSCGCYRAQGATAIYRLDEERGLDPKSLHEAVLAAASAKPRPLALAYRRRQRERIADAHLRLYQELLGRSPALGVTTSRALAG